MTLRLVALISVVLLLSLAAFGLLVQHYQESLMEEVGRTALEVGRATLRTLEWNEGGPKAIPPPGDPVAQVSEHSHTRVVVVQAEGRAGCSPTQGAADCEQTSTAEWVEVAPPDAARAVGEPGRDFLIDVEEVRAEPEHGQGLVLRIPRFHAGDVGAGSKTVQYEMKVVAGQGVVTTHREDIRLPVSLGAFGDLYDGLRRRSLLLCLGVFGVGMVLATGLATRFTRPIRRLDAGLRRLSAGDLDVTVEVQGKDEIARLSRAFNEMALKLRANRERERDMVRREKLSALGRLAAGVAHDVRNPLHSIGLTLQHLSETARPDPSERAAEFDRSLEIIRGEIRRLDQLVGNFLRFARTERRERESVDVAQVVRDTVQLVQKEGERRGVELTTEVDGSSHLVRADGEALRSALLNLVLNGFEAMPRGGRMVIRLHGEAEGVSLEVADDGEGIAEADQERVFEFSYTTREGGNGLGLAMVHHCIVEEHGGRVSLESREGQGTRVRLLLPAGEATA